jgi:nucleolar protein 56
MLDRKRFLQRARESVQEAMRSRDNVLLQSSGAIDEINKASNLLYERLMEWYGLHFPELRLSDQKAYCNAVIALDRGNIDEAALSEAVGKERAASLIGRAKTSGGIELPAEDLRQIRSLAKGVLFLYELREQYEKYIEGAAHEICPNVSHIAGAQLAAKLVAQAGGLHKLALMPASTVQVIGAEKALFKHLKSGSKPPKHGIIFQHPLISTSPKKLRGKIARALATKIAIAAKADAFTKNFIAGKLKEDFERRAKSVLNQK